MLLDIARCPARPRPAKLGSITPTGRRPQSPANNFTEPHSPGRDVPQGRSRLHKSGYFHGFKLRVIERLTRDGDTLRRKATVDDPAVLQEPWKMNPLVRVLDASPNAFVPERQSKPDYRRVRLCDPGRPHRYREAGARRKVARDIAVAAGRLSWDESTPGIIQSCRRATAATLLGGPLCVIPHQRPIILALTPRR
jgi:hypothetical protein